MTKRKDLGSIDWEEFVSDFKRVHSYHRRGLFEIVINNPDGHGKLLGDPQKIENSLPIFAHRLYQLARKAWNEGTIPGEHISQVMRAMVCSFEIDDYFRIDNPEKHSFFRYYVDRFLSVSSSVETNFQEKCDAICQRMLPKTRAASEEIFSKIADEILLFCFCGIKTYYITSDSQSQQAGLDLTDKIIEYIDYLTSKPQNRGLSLKGRASFFRGRFLYRLGQFNEAEKAFDKSVSKYYDKIFWNILSKNFDAESSSLSLRRAQLAQFVGKALICLRQSRLDEALEILANVRPLLQAKEGSGKVRSRHADLVYLTIKRCKNSSNREDLIKCKELAKECLRDFELYTPGSSYVHRCNIEICWINFYLQQTSGSNNEKFALLNESLSLLDKIIINTQHYPRLKLMLIESLIVRAYIYMSFSDLENNGLAFEDAQRARDLSKGMNQLECNSHVALGLIYRNNVIQRAPGIDAEAIENKERAVDCFFEALDVNNYENPRVTAISYLRLAELEMLHQPNYALANFYFKKYEEYKVQNKIEHEYVLHLASRLKDDLSEKQLPEFYLDASMPLHFPTWAKRLKKHLLKLTMLSTANRIDGELPVYQKKGVKTRFKFVTSKVINKKHTTQALLAEVFKTQNGLAHSDAYDCANANLKYFEGLCATVYHHKNQEK